ncbi:MAG TPA: cupredoxin family copper-binding protein [Gemmatimonadales bacterium]|jgi:plastocyanin|nr:cupredoxin family copper-binding protein [Gemmatimonadales bacterium]
MGKHAGRHLAVATLLLASAPGASTAQSVTDRTPNLDDGWTVPVGVIQFNFLHRFEVSAPPARKVTSFPNFHLATGLPLGVNLGLDYATNSTVFTGIPNEYQLTLRRPVLRETAGSPLDVSLVAGYNFAPQSADGELTVGRRVGPVRLLGTVRGMSSAYDVQRSLWGGGGGAVIRLTSWLSLAGDVFALANAPDDLTAATAWGAGAQLRIPYSPHSFSIQFTNTQSGSIEGASRGVRGAHMAGFEFTIPFTLSRYFGHRARPAVVPPAADTAGVSRPVDTTGAARVRIANLSFGPSELRVRAGARVRWVNGDQVQHSVTADNGTFDSGLIDPGAGFERVFDRPGTYAYHCTPHPFMQARVIVEP